jgi:hypothetical protein
MLSQRQHICFVLGFFLRLALLDHNREPGNDKITRLQRGKRGGQKKRPCVAGPFSNNWGNEPFGA